MKKTEKTKPEVTEEELKGVQGGFGDEGPLPPIKEPRRPGGGGGGGGW